MQIRQQKRSYSFVATLLLITFAANFAAGRPDVRQSPFALELQPPLLQPAEESFNPAAAGGQKTIDSYGNPIDALRPIDTPDGRKVVSAQGVQFEIPTYASGITEIRRPADDLLPPHIDAIAVGLEPSSSSDQSPNPKPNSFLGTASASTAPAPIPATSLTPPHLDPSPDTTTVAATATAVEVEQAHLVPLPQQQEDLPEYLRELQRQDPNIGGPVAWQPAEDGTPLSVIAWDLLPPHQDQEKKDQAQEQEPVIITQEHQQPAKRVQGIVDPISNNIRLSLSSGSAAVNSAEPQPQAQEHHQTQTLPEQQQHQQSHADGPAAHGTNAHVGSTTPSNASGRFPNRQRGTAHYSTTRSSSTTLRPRTSTTSTTTTTTTTTTQAPTTARTTPRSTTRTTSTTRASTTSTPRTPTTTEDPATFYRLDNAEEYAYTLPTWLQEVTDPDLDVAVTFEVPTDNDQYNHTLASDLEPPYEPFVDLGNIQLTPPPTGTGGVGTAAPPTTTSSTTPRSTTTSTPRTTTTTTTQAPTTTTTRRPSTKRTTSAPIPTTTHSIPAHPEPPTAKLIQTQNQIQIQPADATRSSTGSSSSSTPSSLDVNPFDSATIPAWLRDFDYPDVGPGVPFDPDNFGPAASSSSNRSPTTPPRPFTDLPTASSAFPSKVTLPLPGSGATSFPSVGSSSSSEEPPLVLIPPADRQDSGLDTGSSSSSSSVPVPVPGPLTHPSTNSVTPLAARFDPQESSSGSSNAIGSGDSLLPVKVEYTKSDDGKVISTPVASIPRKTESATPATSSSSSIGSGKYTGGFGAPAGLLRPQVVGSPNPSPGSNSDIYVAGNQHEFSSLVKANKARPTVNPGRYNGGFRAPTGVLSPQAEPRPFQAVHQQQAQASSSSGAAPGGSRFGGPPGILVPFDSVQRTGGQ